jgi:hypothetical protein
MQKLQKMQKWKVPTRGRRIPAIPAIPAQVPAQKMPRGYSCSLTHILFARVMNSSQRTGTDHAAIAGIAEILFKARSRLKVHKCAPTQIFIALFTSLPDMCHQLDAEK